MDQEDFTNTIINGDDPEKFNGMKIVIFVIACVGIITNAVVVIVFLNYRKLRRKYPIFHPEGTSKNSDNCDFLKVSDIVKSIVVNGEKYILNDTAQFREDPMEIYI